MNLITRQLKKGHSSELVAFKHEIITYLSNKRHITKSVTLLNALHSINKELNSRQVGVQPLKKQIINQDKDISGVEILTFTEFPMFLQDVSPKIRCKRISSDELDLAVDSYSLGTRECLPDDFGNDDLEDYSRVLYGQNYKNPVDSKDTSILDTKSSNDLNLEEDENSYISFC